MSTLLLPEGPHLQAFSAFQAAGSRRVLTVETGNVTAICRDLQSSLVSS
jgi:hypothetical protein